MTFAAGAFLACVKTIAKAVRWLGIPSPGLFYLLFVTAPAIGSALRVLHTAVLRFLHPWQRAMA